MVSMRLLRALREQGVDARMLVMHKSGDSPFIGKVGPAWRRKACFLAEHARIFTANGFNRDTLFQASIANCGMALSRHPWVMDADVVVLAWVNQGMVSLSEIARIKAPVVWVMHDMWCLTGLCHHAGDCIRYKEECGYCPLLASNYCFDLSNTTLLRKQDLYRKKKIHFVAVSNWLARKCRESSLLACQSVSVIPNVFPLSDFRIGEKSGRTVVMGAARLDDTIKGLGTAIEALNLNAGIKAVLFGSIKNESILSRLKIDFEWFGPIADQSRIADIYSHADVVLSASSYETLPGTLIEGMASGCVPVTFGRGGQADIVDHLLTGYIANYPSVEDLARGIKWAMVAGIDPEALRGSVKEKFSADAVAKKYIDLFKKILS